MLAGGYVGCFRMIWDVAGVSDMFSSRIRAGRYGGFVRPFHYRLFDAAIRLMITA